LVSLAARPLSARAQRGEPTRRIGVLMNIPASDPQSSAETAAIVGVLQERGWTLGGKMQIEYRWGAGDASLYRKFSTELVALAPDVILAVGGTAVGALQQASRAIPIIFVDTTDPINRGLIATTARPGSNTTGFVQFEFNFNGKWLELLKEISPNVS
jgi:putative tryptophan/tyrosine transport system substrate-binding protein